MVRRTTKTIAEGLGTDEGAWLIHVLVGDAIGTNEAAAKRLCAKAVATPMADGLACHLVVVKRASHQANLAAKGAAVGIVATVAIAATGAEECAKADLATIGAAMSQPQMLLCGVLTRIYKFLVLDYFEEFIASLRAWAVSGLQVCDASGERHDAQTHARDLQDLCGEKVLPSGLLANWNNGLQHMEHVALPGPGGETDAATGRTAVARALGREPWSRVSASVMWKAATRATRRRRSLIPRSCSWRVCAMLSGGWLHRCSSSPKRGRSPTRHVSMEGRAKIHLNA